MMEMESPRRSASPPEFEFWMLGNTHPQLEPSVLLTADELFADGVLLPLHLLSIHPDPNPEPKPAPPGFGSGTPEPLPRSSKQERGEEAAASASICRESSICSSNSTPLTSSKRWKDIFKVGEKKKESVDEKEKKERKASNGGGGGSGGGAAELNINIWPFSRSRSAGTAAGGRPKAAAAAAMRKSSSAPCSRSNSRGENSGGRRWAASPGRPGAGVHVGRASPVWQVRRAGKGAEGRAGKVSRPKGGNRGLGLNVNSCIGYRSQLSCRSDDYDEKRGASNANGSLSKIRALFSKKVY